MTPEELKAREMGELTNSVKNTNIILERMENKLDSAIETVGTHSNTIALLTRISSENSGMIKDIQNRLNGENGRNGIVRDVDELKKFKCDREKFEDENRKGFKDILFKSLQWIIIAVMGIILGYHELKTK
jgi:hypothetical protein